MSPDSESSKSVTPAKQDQPSVKQSVTPAKQDQPSVKQSVTPAKQDQPSVKQSVTQNMINDKESFTQTPTSHASTKHNKKKKIILTPMKSPITQIKGGIKKTATTEKKIPFSKFHKPERDNGNRNRIMQHTPRLR